MQIHKPNGTPAEKTAFASLPSAAGRHLKKDEWNAAFGRFVLQAHTYHNEKLASEAITLLREPEKVAERSAPFISRSLSLFDNQHERITDVLGAYEYARTFLEARNAMLLYSLVSEPYTDYLPVSAEKIRSMLAAEKCQIEKSVILEAAGAFGNFLPSQEYVKLEGFLVNYLLSEENSFLKACTADALAYMLSTKALLPIMNAAEKSGMEDFETAAYRASIAVPYARKMENMMHVLLPCFLFGAYFAETKISAASLMYSFGTPQFDYALSSYFSHVKEAVGLIKKKALAAVSPCMGKFPQQIKNEVANLYLKGYYDATGFYEDIVAYRELKPYAEGVVETARDC